MSSHKQTEGIKWGEGTVTNARWSGYRLRDLIASVGIPDDCKEYKKSGKMFHACFASEAPTIDDRWYGASVPIDMILCTWRNAILATHVSDL